MGLLNLSSFCFFNVGFLFLVLESRSLRNLSLIWGKKLDFFTMFRGFLDVLDVPLFCFSFPFQ
jgi:hypothetical protein